MIALASNADPKQVELAIPQPKACEVYYKVCKKIDQHNHSCQYNLKIKTKLETKRWDICMNLSISAIIVVNA